MRLLFAAGLMALAPRAALRRRRSDAEDIAAESKKLTDYLNAEFEEELAMNPMMLTTMGRKELYDQLGDFSEADAPKQLEWRRESVAGMKAQVDPAKLNDDAKTSLGDLGVGAGARGAAQQVAAAQLYLRLSAGRTPDLPNFLITYHKVDEPADMDAYVARIAKLGAAIDQYDRAREAGGGGWHPHAEIRL